MDCERPKCRRRAQRHQESQARSRREVERVSSLTRRAEFPIYNSPLKLIYAILGISPYLSDFLENHAKK